MRSSVSQAPMQVPMRNNFFSPAPVRNTTDSKEILVPARQSTVSNAPLNQSMDTIILDYDRKQFKNSTTVIAAIRSCGEVCYSTNPTTVSTSWSCDTLQRLFNCCMEPTNCISLPCYCASMHAEKIPFYSCFDMVTGIFCLCPIATVDFVFSSTMVAVCAPLVCTVDMAASACHVPFKPPSLKLKENIELAIATHNLPQLITLMKEKTMRNMVLIDHCTSIMRATAEGFDQPILMQQRIQLYAHMACLLYTSDAADE